MSCCSKLIIPPVWRSQAPPTGDSAGETSFGDFGAAAEPAAPAPSAPAAAAVSVEEEIDEKPTVRCVWLVDASAWCAVAPALAATYVRTRKRRRGSPPAVGLPSPSQEHAQPADRAAASESWGDFGASAAPPAPPEPAAADDAGFGQVQSTASIVAQEFDFGDADPSPPPVRRAFWRLGLVILLPAGTLCVDVEGSGPLLRCGACGAQSVVA